MFGIFIKRSFVSSFVIRTFWKEHRLARNNSKYVWLCNMHGIHIPKKINPLSIGLLAGCCFSKQNENADADPIISECDVADEVILQSEELLDQTTEHETNNAADLPNYATCSSNNLKPSVPVKRLSSEIVNDCKAKYQKLEEDKLGYEVAVGRSAVSQASSFGLDGISKGALPTADTKKSKNEEVSDVTKDGVATQKSKKKPKQRPNYFISMKISNPVIHKSLEAVQTHIMEQNSKLKPAVVPLNKLHITLMVLYLSNDDEIDKAFKVLNSFYETLNEDISKHPLTLEFTGLGTFNDKVLFAKIKPGDAFDRLSNIAKDVLKYFEEASIFSTDKKSFNPHLTLMKLSRAPKLFHQGIKKIDPSLYSSYKDHVFGSELIKSIELLSMMGKDISGYYQGHHLLFGVADRSALATSSALLTEEIGDKKQKISQLAQQQLQRLSVSGSDENVSSDRNNSASVKAKNDRK